MTIDLRKANHQAAQHAVRVPDAPRAQVEAHIPRTRVAPRRAQERAVMAIAAGAALIIVLILLVFGVTKVWDRFFGGTDAEVRSLVSSVGHHMLLPTDETPTLATVSDMHALEGQEFFKNAKEGDKVLMYLRTHRAIIYRPSIDRIIEVGPITGKAQ